MTARITLSLPFDAAATDQAAEKLQAAGVESVCGQSVQDWLRLAYAEDERICGPAWVNPYRVLVCLAAAVAKTAKRVP